MTNLQLTTACCDVCKCHYITGPAEDEFKQCPRCVPGQPRPRRELMLDPTYFPGTGFVWEACIGRGKWEPIGERVLVPIQDIRDLRDLFPDADRGRPVFQIIRDEIRRLRGDDAVPINASTRPRFEELANRCQILDDDLRRKRAQCDELRDERDALKAELERLKSRK